MAVILATILMKQVTAALVTADENLAKISHLFAL